MTNPPSNVGRRALLTGTALTALAAAARAQSQSPAAPAAATLADVPLSATNTVTVERRGDIVLIGLNRTFIFNRLDPATRLRLGQVLFQYRARPVAARRGVVRTR